MIYFYVHNGFLNYESDMKLVLEQTSEDKKQIKYQNIICLV